MKAYTFSAVQTFYDAGAVVSSGPVEVVLTFPDDVTGIDYTLVGLTGAPYGNAVFRTMPLAVTIGGEAVAPGAIEPTINEAVVTEGNAVTQTLILQVDDMAMNTYIWLGGAPLPDVQSAADYNATLGRVPEATNLAASPIPLGTIAALQDVSDVGPSGAIPVDRPGIMRAASNTGEILSGSADADTLTGGPGGDRLEGLGSGDDIFGEGGPDGLLGGAGDDLLDGGRGADTIAASHGNDLATGGPGADFIGGGLGNDTIIGDDGFETVRGGNDTIGGGLGDDFIIGDLGDDVIAAGAGDDRVVAGSGHDTVGLSYGNDSVMGDAGDDELGGGFGRDVLVGGSGADSIGGGEGDDKIYGDDGDDFLAGGGRDDFISGDSGADTINGGSGDDQFYGGDGADVFVWNAADAGAVDWIHDFEDGRDTIRLTGVENAPGSGFIGRLDALALTDTMVRDIEVLVIHYQDQEIHVVGRQAHEFDLGDFVFV